MQGFPFVGGWWREGREGKGREGKLPVLVSVGQNCYCNPSVSSTLIEALLWEPVGGRDFVGGGERGDVCVLYE